MKTLKATLKMKMTRKTTMQAKIGTTKKSQRRRYADTTHAVTRQADAY